MSKEMIITTSPQETKVAILEEDQLVEVHIERSHEQGLVGSIYKGRVTKVLPGMQSAFVNIGLERDAFLYVSDFFEDAEEYDSIVATVEDKIEKLESSPDDAAPHPPSPAVIEIPTRLKPSQSEGTAPSISAVPQAFPERVPPIAQAAVMAQPTPVSEKAAETDTRPEPEKGSSASSGAGPGEAAQKSHNELDRQSRGRYGRRRGRRRPWERHREEPCGVQPPPVQTPPPVPAGATNPPSVVSALTPLPGESLSKFQQTAVVPEEGPPKEQESSEPKPAAAVELAVSAPPSKPEPPVVAAGESEREEDKEPRTTSLGSAASVPSWRPEAKLIPNQPEALEQVERILSMLDVPSSTLQPPAKTDTTPPSNHVDKDQVIALDVSETGTDETIIDTPVLEDTEHVLETAATMEETISLPVEEISAPVDRAPIEVPRSEEASAVEPVIPLVESRASERLESEGEPPASTPVESPGTAGSEITVLGTAGAISEPEVGRPPILGESAGLAAPIEEKGMLQRVAGLPSAEEQREQEFKAGPPEVSEFHAKNLVESLPTQPSPAAERAVPEESFLSTPPSDSSRPVASFGLPTEPVGRKEETILPLPAPRALKETGANEAAIRKPEAEAPASEPPQTGGKALELAEHSVSEPQNPPVALTAPVTSAVQSPEVKPREESRPERVAPRSEKLPASRPSPAIQRFEGRRPVPPSVQQPEVYGPPTPYEYMTDEEKVQYNTRRSPEKASAKILDSSRKLTAPQPRDYGYQRGRRGRRGRKRFGEHEAALEQVAPREEKRSTARPLIADLLREGQEILVQIAKEPLGKKGARITSHIALPGRYLVYMPTVDHIGVSRKISTDEERRRLKRVLNENRQGLPGGFIVRTAGEARSEDELKQDIRFLANTWSDIRARAEKRAAPALMHRDLGVLERILRDQLSSEFTAIRLDNETEYAKVLEFVNQFQPALVGRVKLHLKDTPIFEEYGIDHEMEKALKPKVWLKSGGYIVINQTEAMVAIDVNTGKFVGKTTRLEDTIVRTNIDAAKEVARQIRLRDMGGIIVIDFIDMEERKNRQKVIQALEEAMRHDRAPSKILSFNDFGLVALTRKRVKQSLEKTLLQPCSYCQGHGMIKSVQTVCYEIQSEAKKMAPMLDGRELRIRVHPEVARALKTSEQAVVAEIEGHTRKDVIIKADPQTHQDQFEIY